MTRYPRILAGLLASIVFCSEAHVRSAPPTATDRRPIVSLVPADALVVYAAKPFPSLAPTTQPATTQATNGPNLSSVATTVVGFLSATGLMPDEGQVFADIAFGLPLLGRFEHALALLDVSSRIVESRDDTAGESSLRLNRLQAAVVFRTNGEHAVVLDQLNRIVGRYTNDQLAKLSDVTAGELSYQRLEDSRLTGWAIWEWGRMGDFSVLTFGEGAYEQVGRAYLRKSANLADDAWFVSASSKTKGDQALAQWFISLERLRANLGTAPQQRVNDVTRALKAEGITQDLWTVGREGRALSWYRCYRRNGENVIHRLSDPARYAEEHRRIIPDQAEHIAIIQMPTKYLVDNLPTAWLAAQSESNADKWRRIWDRLEEEAGTDINGNLISHLGETVVLFDYPPHPLHIPFALTVAIEIKDRRSVAIATGAMLEAWGRYLDERAERLKTTLVRLKVKKSEDGIWYLQAGILGPALKVTDRYLVLSWSPEALRDALKYIEGPQINSSSSPTPRSTKAVP